MASGVETLPPGVALDGLRLFAGKLLGVGAYREVYENLTDPGSVIKFDMQAGNFHNALEAHVWERVRWTRFSRWFAPVLGIAPWGSAMLMARTEPLTTAQKKRWTRVPFFFTDLKPANFGCYKGRLVCHDYGCNLLMEVGMTTRMQTVRWDQ